MLDAPAGGGAAPLRSEESAAIEQLLVLVRQPTLYAWLDLIPPVPPARAEDALRSRRAWAQGQQSNPKYRAEALWVIRHHALLRRILVDEPGLYEAHLAARARAAVLSTLDPFIFGVLAGGPPTPEAEAAIVARGRVLGLEPDAVRERVQILAGARAGTPGDDADRPTDPGLLAPPSPAPAADEEPTTLGYLSGRVGVPDVRERPSAPLGMLPPPPPAPAVRAPLGSPAPTPTPAPARAPRLAPAPTPTLSPGLELSPSLELGQAEVPGAAARTWALYLLGGLLMVGVWAGVAVLLNRPPSPVAPPSAPAAPASAVPSPAPPAPSAAPAPSAPPAAPAPPAVAAPAPAVAKPAPAPPAAPPPAAPAPPVAAAPRPAPPAPARAPADPAAPNGYLELPPDLR